MPAPLLYHKECTECGEAFTARRIDGRMCSATCRQRAVRRRRRAAAESA